MDANDTSIVDEAGSIVKQRFYDFILESQSAEESENTTHQQRLMIDYKAQISSMIQNDKTTLFVSYQHLSDFDYELMEGFSSSLIVGFLASHCLSFHLSINLYNFHQGCTSRLLYLPSITSPFSYRNGVL